MAKTLGRLGHKKRSKFLNDCRTDSRFEHDFPGCGNLQPVRTTMAATEVINRVWRVVRRVQNARYRKSRRDTTAQAMQCPGHHIPGYALPGTPRLGYTAGTPQQGYTPYPVPGTPPPRTPCPTTPGTQSPTWPLRCLAHCGVHGHTDTRGLARNDVLPEMTDKAGCGFCQKCIFRRDGFMQPGLGHCLVAGYIA